ncbi:TPA: hypothetical protein N0F65_007545 [Lagenidium giganteum]|uniref:BED-type domain-containing protein n=1 Tax=Lagenidium giganteum TaxID=4803 RepID=A0AAV2ZD38_9STRA|nr:TPA: hypothetical protein N0F65_007545 [Lagenidium giganteum]
MASNKDYCTYFFSKASSGRYRCIECGTIHKQQDQTGYTNLMSHLRSKHEGYRLAFASRAPTDATLQTFGFVSTCRPAQLICGTTRGVRGVDEQSKQPHLKE